MIELQEVGDAAPQHHRLGTDYDVEELLPINERSVDIGDDETTHSSGWDRIRLAPPFTTIFASAQRDGSTFNTQYGYDWLFAKRFFRLMSICWTDTQHIPFWFLDSFRRGWALKAPWGVLLLSIAVIIQNYVVSYTGQILGTFYECIVRKDQELFYHNLLLAALQIAASGLLDSTIKFFIELFSWQWRAALCKLIHTKYFQNSHYYLSLFKIDNPDQLLTQDVENFTATLSDVLSKCLMGPVTIVYYTYLTGTEISYYAPLIIYAYFFIGLLFNKIIMSPTVRAVFQQDQYEGEFRYAHARVRTFAEVIAMYRGTDTEKSFLNKCLRRLLYSKAKVLWLHWGLNVSTNGISYLVSILTYVVVAIPVMYGPSEATIADVSVKAFYCMQLIYGFSLFVNVSQQLSSLAGYTHRIGLLLETLERLSDESIREDNKCSLVREDSDEEKKVNVEVQSEENNEESRMLETPTENVVNITNEAIVKVANHWEFQAVSCRSPDGRVIIENISFKVEKSRDENTIHNRNNNILIVGSPGCGKTTILRVLHGLWSIEMRGTFIAGDITRPPDADAMFLPQKPYLLLVGSLKEQIVYPDRNTDDKLISDGELSELLQSVGLSRLLTRQFQGTITWADCLSPGEEQLLSFARLFYRRPYFAALDEATSALPVQMEERLYQRCVDLGISVISVGHRPSLTKYHSQILSHNETGWTLDFNPNHVVPSSLPDEVVT